VPAFLHGIADQSSQKGCWQPLSWSPCTDWSTSARCSHVEESAGSTSMPRRSHLCPCCCLESCKCVPACPPYASIFLLLGRASQPNIAFLGRLPETGPLFRQRRHEACYRWVGIIAFRPEASLLYINAETIWRTVLKALRKSSDVRLVACDLSASPYIDLAGARRLHDLHDESGIASCDVLHRRRPCAVARSVTGRKVWQRRRTAAEWLRTLDSVLGRGHRPGERSGLRVERPPGP